MEYYSFSSEYGAADELFKAVLSLDKKRVAELRAAGVGLTEDVKRVLVNGGGPMVSNKPETRLWYFYLTDIMRFGAADFVYISREFYRETGAALYYSENVRDAVRKNFFSAEVFGCFLDCYNQSKMNKTLIMKGAINANSVECLAMCAEHGWLKLPRKRDEMIEYASRKQKTEITAFLLEFKNKNFNLAEERVKAEKKIERELNAAPDSASELKKSWSSKKREDGGLVITSYKGTRGEIIVPERIGKSSVVEIGEYAFAASAPRITIEQRDFRRKEITRVKLPSTITKIGKDAFSSCEALEEINFPEGLAEIGEDAFMGCRKLTEISLPDSVRTLTRAFAGCLALRSVRLPEGLCELGGYAFANCPSLEKITLPASLKVIGAWAFARCGKLKEIVIPDGVTEIGQRAFMECGELKTVVIPASVKMIEDYKYKKQPPQNVFHNSPNVTAVVEPESFAEEYCKTNGIKFVYREDKGK